MHVKRLILAILSTSLTVCLSLQSGTGQDDPLQLLLDNSDLAKRNPDQFNWELFVLLARPAAQQTMIPTIHEYSRDSIWEAWPDDYETFPVCPNSKTGCMDNLALYKPKWNQSGRGTTPHPDPLNLLASATPALKQSEHVFTVKLCRFERSSMFANFEVRRNQPAFETIVSNELWYKEGLAEWAHTPGHSLKFQPHSVEVKAYWIPINETDEPKFHWNYGPDGKIYGLTGLHIMTNTLGKWTWATWEWSGERKSSGASPAILGSKYRCELTGCTDIYGSLAKYTPENQGHISNDPTPELDKLFARYKLSAEWRNYRLKGTQTITDRGDVSMPLLGDSKMESGFLDSSSCMSCHARAGVTKSGKLAQIFENEDPIIGAAGRPQTPKSGGTDFVWAFVQAQPMSPQPSTPVPGDPCP